MLLGKRAATRGSHPHAWDLPGGHGEPGESPEQTLVRELGEEIGVIPVSTRRLGTFHIVDGDRGWLELSVYLVTEWMGEPKNCRPDEHDALGWFSVEEACDLALATPLYLDLFRLAQSVV